MAIPKDDKLKVLLKMWPHGVVLSTNLLIQELGYSKGLLQQYCRSGWLRKVGVGAYSKPETDRSGKLIELNWRGGLYGLQSLVKSDSKFPEPPIHIAARSALEISGYAHFLSQSNQETIYIFVTPKFHVPKWFKNFDWRAKVIIHAPKLFKKALPNTISQKDWGSFSSPISCPERAILELLELCPKFESLDHAKKIMESLATLRPKITQELLVNCTSIKAKRLFLALADQCNHEWLKEIDLKKIDLGQGPRVLEPGHGYHTKFNISVPKAEG